jgi:cytochrome c-type biogenesis protein CcmH/NrfG
MRSEVTEIGQGGGCPDAINLARFAAGVLDHETSRKVMQHLTGCAACGGQLRMISSLDGDDLTPEELALIEALPSSRPAGQKALARKLAARQRAFSPMLRIAAAIAGVGVMLGGLSYYLQTGPEQMIARAYSSRRPFAFRLTGGGAPGPIHVERSSFGISSLTRELVDALDRLNTAVSRKPDDPRLLAAAGQAKLMAFRFDEATAALERAHRMDPGNERITADLATALALQSERVEAGETNRPIMARSLQLLDEALQQRPADTVARFNRALVLRALGRESEAEAELQRCLHDEPDGAWRGEITRQLNLVQH